MFWEEGKKKALSGIGWLSYHSGAPVLPIGFSDTTGALNPGLKFKRPRFNMNVGQVLLAVELIPEEPRKKPGNNPERSGLFSILDVITHNQAY